MTFECLTLAFTGGDPGVDYVNTVGVELSVRLGRRRRAARKRTARTRAARHAKGGSLMRQTPRRRVEVAVLILTPFEPWG